MKLAKNLDNLGLKVPISKLVETLSMAARENSLDGVVCSVSEVLSLKKNIGKDFITVNKQEITPWEEIKHIVISLMNDFYSSGKECVIECGLVEQKEDLKEIEMKIVKILDQKKFPYKQDHLNAVGTSYSSLCDSIY